MGNLIRLVVAVVIGGYCVKTITGEDNAVTKASVIVKDKTKSLLRDWVND